MIDQIEVETPVRSQQMALGRAAAELVDLCRRNGMVAPFTVTMVSPNGMIVAVRTDRDASGIKPILEHYPQPLATYPVTITVVDCNGEASAWRLSADGTLAGILH